MNILTIGIDSNVTSMLDALHASSNDNQITHLFRKEDAIAAIKNRAPDWDWIIIQGHDDPDHWKSILCAVNANSSNTQITVLSSHIDGTRLKTPVCSMHNEGGQMSVSRCAMQNLLEQDQRAITSHAEDKTTPIIFEYHSPCR